MLSAEQKGQVIIKVKELVAQINELYNVDMAVPKVQFSLKGRAAGIADSSSWVVNFNEGLLVDNWDRYMEDTIPHEVAHLAKAHIYGYERKGKFHSPHGYYWKEIMRKLGYEPTRCHDMDTSKVANHKTKFVYECPTCKKLIPLGPHRHKKIQQGSRYFHSKCGRENPLQYVGCAGKVSNNKATVMFQTKSTPKKQESKKMKEPRPGTKIAHALLIYREMRKTTNNRQDIISAIANSMQIDRHRAAGYYQNCKKREES